MSVNQIQKDLIFERVAIHVLVSHSNVEVTLSTSKSPHCDELYALAWWYLFNREIVKKQPEVIDIRWELNVNVANRF